MAQHGALGKTPLAMHFMAPALLRLGLERQAADAIHVSGICGTCV